MTCGAVDDLQSAISRIDAAMCNNIAGNPILERKWELIGVYGPCHDYRNGRAFLKLYVNRRRLFEAANAIARSAHEWQLEFGSVRFEFNYTTEMPITIHLKQFQEEGK